MTFSNRGRLVSAACPYPLMRGKCQKWLKGVRGCTRKLCGQVGDGRGTDLELRVARPIRRRRFAWLQLLQEFGIAADQLAPARKVHRSLQTRRAITRLISLFIKA